MEWIKLTDRLPTKKEQNENWKFLVSNYIDDWVDCAYYDETKKQYKWNNGECDIIPTHWQCLPKAFK
jgi:hypothetical protein